MATSQEASGAVIDKVSDGHDEDVSVKVVEHVLEVRLTVNGCTTIWLTRVLP